MEETGGRAGVERAFGPRPLQGVYVALNRVGITGRGMITRVHVHVRRARGREWGGKRRRRARALWTAFSHTDERIIKSAVRAARVPLIYVNNNTASTLMSNAAMRRSGRGKLSYQS